MKWDYLQDEIEVELGPQLPEQLDPEYSYTSTDRLLDRVDSLNASIKSDGLTYICVTAWDPECQANISLYRTKPYFRLQRQLQDKLTPLAG